MPNSPAGSPSDDGPPPLSPDDERRLDEVLTAGRAAGFLGPGPVEPQRAHALGFVDLLAGAVPPRDDRQPTVVDLGSGAGLPGLVIALARPDLHVVLVEATARRATHLRQAIDRLGVEARVEVVQQRAEEVGRERRGHADAVVARSFAPPAVTAECAAPLLRVGGVLITSEPPEPDPHRWPPDPMRQLGAQPGPRSTVVGSGSFQLVVQVEACPDRFPRRVGVPERRPLW